MCEAEHCSPATPNYTKGAAETIQSQIIFKQVPWHETKRLVVIITSPLVNVFLSFILRLCVSNLGTWKLL